MTATTESAPVADVDLCNICEDNPRLGKLARHKMKEICIECAVKLRDDGHCPVCRGTDVVKNKGSEHIATCNGKLPREPKPKSESTTKRKSKKERDLEEERKVMEAQERLDKRRAARDAPVKNVREMNLEELQTRLDGYWIDLGRSTSTKTERVHIRHVTALDGDEIELTSGNGAVRTIDRTLIRKIQRP